MKVLVSAYACEPHWGSEPEVGWQWAWQMSRFHDVTVLTRATHKRGIDAALPAQSPEARAPRFVYHELPAWMLRWERILHLNPWFHYLLWQRSAWRTVSELHAEFRFDLLHHLTWTEFRSTPAIWGHGVPTVWGPVNGSELTPWQLMSVKYPNAMLHELARNCSSALVVPGLRAKAAASSAILVSARETEETFTKLGIRTVLLPECGLHWRECQPRVLPEGPLRFLINGRLEFHKGVHLALQALAASGVDAGLWIYGEGEFKAVLERLTRNLGLGKQVRFMGRLSYREMLRREADFDVLMLPSLHDSGSVGVLEAMAGGLPVICLDCGGSAIAVSQDCGIKVPLGDSKTVVVGLANAIRRYDADRSLVAVHSQNARRHVLENYLWDRKGEQLDSIYWQVVGG